MHLVIDAERWLGPPLRPLTRARGLPHESEAASAQTLYSALSTSFLLAVSDSQSHPDLKGCSGIKESFRRA